MSDAINRLPAEDTITTSTQFAAFSSNAGVDVRVPLSLLQAYLQANLTFNAGITQFITQYSAPSATAFTVTLTDGTTGTTANSGNIRLILTPAAGYAAGTIKFPIRASCIDKQQVLVTCSQQINVVTWDINGSDAVANAPTAIAAGDRIWFMYDINTHTWHRVG